MYIKKLIKLVLLVIIFVLLYGCDTGGGGNVGGEDDDNSSNITVESIKWGEDDGWIRFYTNDRNMIGEKGSSYWYPRKYKEVTDDVIEVDVNKISGSDYYGYGIIFCIQDEPVNDTFVAKSFYCVLIRVDGYYQIVKVVNKKQHILKLNTGDDKGWNYGVDSNGKLLLRKGKNVSNRIRVEISEDSGGIACFKIKFNGTEIYSFRDNYRDDEGEELPLFKKVDGAYKYGFIVTLSPNEGFPFVPVDVRFKQIVPEYSKGRMSNKVYMLWERGREEDIYIENSNVF